MKLDAKVPLSGTLHARGAAYQVGTANAEAIRRLANVKLEFAQDGVRPKGAVRSTHEFDLALDVPQALTGAHRARLEKEKEQLEKAISNNEQKLADEEFVSKAPPKVVETMRQKLFDYKTQLAKIIAALHDLAA